MEEKHKLKARIERITIYETARSGEPLVATGRDGMKRPYVNVMMNVPTDAVDDVDFNGRVSFLDFNGISNSWNVDTEIEGIVVKKIVGDKIYWNFKIPRSEDALELRVSELERRIEEVESLLLKQSIPTVEEIGL